MLFKDTSLFERCPKCDSKNAQEVRFTWWGGSLLTKTLNQVKCQTCGAIYDGETGQINKTKIIFCIILFNLAVIILLELFNFF
jgi:hypothetical protein